MQQCRLSSWQIKIQQSDIGSHMAPFAFTTALTLLRFSIIKTCTSFPRGTDDGVVFSLIATKENPPSFTGFDDKKIDNKRTGILF